jgi:hypothetical protein
MSYLFFVKSETKPAQTEISGSLRIAGMRTIFTNEDSPREIHDTDGGYLGGLPPCIVVEIVVRIQALRH